MYSTYIGTVPSPTMLVVTPYYKWVAGMAQLNQVCDPGAPPVAWLRLSTCLAEEVDSDWWCCDLVQELV